MPWLVSAIASALTGFALLLVAFIFWRPVDSFAPVACIMAAFCALIISFGMVQQYFKKLSLQLNRRNSRLRQFFDEAIYGIALSNPLTGIIVDCNEAFARMLETSKADIIGKHQRNFHAVEELEEDFSRTFRQHLGENMKQPLESKMITSSGQIIDVEIIGNLVDLKSGQLLQGFFKDITARKHAEKTLHNQEQLLKKSQELGHIGSWELDLQQNKLVWTEENHRIFGIPFGTEPSYELFLEMVHPDDRGYVNREWKAAIAGKDFDIEHRIIVENQPRWVREKATVVFDQDGNAVKAFGLTQDITQQKHAETKHFELESQLRQAQKIESVGRLAGGIAHDYNNMLSVIIGYAELATIKVDSSSLVRGDLEQILAAANSSRDITRQLLAFARKQPLDPRVLDLNAEVGNMLKMMRQLLGENIDLVWRPREDLWPIKVDSSQLGQVLANLCVNACDAIADVGRMIIETDMVTLDKTFCENHLGFTPGDFVVLVVNDNGCGMDRATLDKIFEPFFTTKKAGQGTGLGLSTVYGIVKQSNGFILADSETGQGSTFKIYLPRYSEEETQAEHGTGSEEVHMGHGESVLLVEDEISILELAATTLNDLGYEVLSANTPSHALSLAEQHPGTIHLLITDVVMPEMNGRKLADRLLVGYPQLKCLYMSGYPADILSEHFVEGEEIKFIHKPFSRNEFSIKIREALGFDTILH